MTVAASIMGKLKPLVDLATDSAYLTNHVYAFHAHFHAASIRPGERPGAVGF